MASSTLIYEIEKDLFRYGGPILIVIGSISCILNLMVFMKDGLRKNPCSVCFIAINMTNFAYIYLGLLFVVLPSGYGIDPSTNNIDFCRFRYYADTILTCWESSYLILASIDRTMITSRNANTRKRSTRRLIFICIISIAIFWALFHIHALIFAQILEEGPNYFVCYYQPGAYTTFITYYSLFINGLIPPFLMILFGIQTVKNARQLGRKTGPAKSSNVGSVSVGGTHIVQSKDQQLIRIVLVDIITYIICKCPVTLFLIYQQITQYQMKSAQQEIIEQLVAQIIYFVFFMETSIGCYTNLLVSKTFRRELKLIFIRNHDA
ncbi:unnamed protein product [Adineta steineri]|uniref:G-protein coupled receptors family 1 profile domain-containing protein n=1 Tax=Adineta steineri TaxID=433720 RepID=A0A814E6M2_9BILA|nr:unnamed protein product [Adineta steineri]